MKLLILSDIHANWPALQAVLAAEPDADSFLCLGDLVNYGPQPAECVRWAMGLNSNAKIIQGDHDYSVGHNRELQCSFAFYSLAEATRKATEHFLTPEMKIFLTRLKPLQEFKLEMGRCIACHATPSDPLHLFMLDMNSIAVWEAELFMARYPDFLFLGHTHVPVNSRFRRTAVVNPGSAGLPRDGDSRASYAVCQDGEISLRRVPYDIEETIRAYDGLPLASQIKESLSEILRTASPSPPFGHN